jgi:hypothetical protein
MAQEMLDDGMQLDQVVSRAGHRARKLLRYRTEMVARTETMAAENGGLQLAWEQAEDDGLLLPQTRKVWIATPMGKRTCDICREWDGVKAMPNEPFKKGGRQIMGPPLHPSCRCSMGLETKLDRRSNDERVFLHRSATTALFLEKIFRSGIR